MKISTPHFGACVDEKQNLLTSSLFPKNCLGSSTYLKPNDAIDILGRPFDAGDVTIGRCSSSLPDDDHCAASRGACVLKEKFQSNVESCNLYGDTATAMSATLFPSCRDSSSGKRRCALSESECVTGEQVRDPVFTMNMGGDPCHCQHVPTGLCHASNDSAAGESYCAVGPHDCEAEEIFVTALELSVMADPPRTCRLCEEGGDASPKNDGIRLLETGGCYDSDGIAFLRCAFERSECDDDEVFRSASKMNRSGDVPCETELMKVGRCSSSLDGHCANVAEACTISSKFIPTGSCTVREDNQQGALTYFGYCDNHEFDHLDPDSIDCAWSGMDCDDSMKTNSWRPARIPLSGSDWFPKQCDCAEVRTGACFDAYGEYYCAVSKNACDDPDNFLGFQYLRSHPEMQLECRLCAPEDPHTMSQTEAITTEKPEDRSDMTSSPRSMTGGNGGAIVLGIGVSLCALFGIYFFYPRYAKRSTRNDTPDTTSPEPCTGDIETIIDQTKPIS